MTNLLAQLAINLVLATNWTGVYSGTNELGYVVTNHIAVITHEGATNEVQLKSVPSSTAVWRPAAVVQSYIMTNHWWNVPAFSNCIVTTNVNANFTLEIKPAF